MQQIKRIAKALLLPPLQYFQRKRREAEIRQRAAPICFAQLRSELDKIPVPRDSVVLIHSSLKSLGFVEGGAQTVVDSFIESFVKQRNITIMLPTYSIDGTMYSTLKSMRTFDVAKTPSNLGAIPETFRRQPDAVRSLHPSHSFAAIGPKADWLVGNHHLAGTNFGAGTPMARLLETDSYLLGLGSDIGHVTFYHCLEDLEAFPFTVYAEDGPFAATCIDAHGQVQQLSLPAHAVGPLQKLRIDHSDSGALRAFVAARLEENAGLNWHQVGQARCWLVPAQRMYQEMLSLMHKGITIYTPPAELQRFAVSGSPSAD